MTLVLDPSKAPVENAENRYKQVSKLKRAHEAIVPLLEAATKEPRYIQELLNSLEQLAEWKEQADYHALLEIQASLCLPYFTNAKARRLCAAINGHKSVLRSKETSIGAILYCLIIVHLTF